MDDLHVQADNTCYGITIIYIFLILGSFAAVTIFYQIPKENETGFGKNVMV